MKIAVKKAVMADVPVVPTKERRTKVIVRSIINEVGKWSTDKKIDIIEDGVSKYEVEEVKQYTGLDYETLAHILSVTKATLHNKKGNEKFNAVVSERLLMLADIYVYGIEVFGEKERFNRWLISNIRALGGKRPVDRMNTQLGMQEVRHIIGRIAYGVYS